MNKPAGASNYFHQVALKASVNAIPLLNEENYSIRKDKMLMLFDLKDIKDAITRNEGPLSTKQDREIRAIILSKLDSTTHSNVINSSNISSSKLLCAEITRRFASSKTANQARVFNQFLHSPFNNQAVDGFVTKMRKAINRMTNVGIKLPKDILAYLILFKFPPPLENLKQQIMHVERLVTVDVVFNHLIQ